MTQTQSQQQRLTSHAPAVMLQPATQQRKQGQLVWLSQVIMQVRGECCGFEHVDPGHLLTSSLHHDWGREIKV